MARLRDGSTTQARTKPGREMCAPEVEIDRGVARCGSVCCWCCWCCYSRPRILTTPRLLPASRIGLLLRQHTADTNELYSYNVDRAGE